MALSGLYSPHVRDALKKPAAFGADMLLVVLFLAIFGAILMVGQRMAAPFTQTTTIDLSIRALPKYTLLSLGRGFAAYFLSLAFTLIYGTIAAHNRRAEAVMIPVLDVLQAIPVLGFMPGVVLALVALSPNHQLGLEAACIVMIFTGQVWNMTFSFHGSLKAIPQTLREVAAIHRLSRWRFFSQLELPASMIGLIWNSMMSMAGGWFFLSVTEAFTLKGHDYRLPGIGSYMNEAILQGDVPAMVAAVIAMVLMIVFVDQVVWRPLVAWSQRFKVEDLAATTEPKSWVLSLIRRSAPLRNFLSALDASRHSLLMTGFSSAAARQMSFSSADRRPTGAILRAGLRFVLLGGLAAVVVWGGWSLLRLLGELPLIDSSGHGDWRSVFEALGASFLRTTSAVLLGAAWTLPAGILIGLSPRWSARLQPIIQVLASFPAPMLFPIVTFLLVSLHVDFNVGCTALMLLGTQWYILFNVIAGASSTPADLQEVASIYRWTTFQKWTRLYIPCVFPYLVTGLITAAGGAWNATIVAEYVVMKDQTHEAFGLGSIINHASADGNFPLLAASVVTMAVAVVLLNRSFWRQLYRLAEQRFSLTGGS
ncbi:MAG TPA: ABC transporter permease subunit [Planctomycetaceae bacterium]|jgi:NitT/TauT family transport system permease protein|nr:ABC transporter permease subunit [Planctomycetaceae bacterium]